MARDNHEFSFGKPKASTLPLEEVVDRIIRLNENIEKFWKKAGGWAPPETMEILSEARLDWQVSLSHRLKDVFRAHPEEEDKAKLIESWVRLGTLVENSMRLAFSVYVLDYRKSEKDRFKDRKMKDPDSIKFEMLKTIFSERLAEDFHHKWLSEIQTLRNAVHSFKGREVHDWDRYKSEIRNYLEFLRHVNDRLPYPDHIYVPQE